MVHHPGTPHLRQGFLQRDDFLTDPCRTCRRTAYAIHLGALDPAQTRQLANALRALARSRS